MPVRFHYIARKIPIGDSSQETIETLKNSKKNQQNLKKNPQKLAKNPQITCKKILKNPHNPARNPQEPLNEIQIYKKNSCLLPISYINP
jgi:hypothetical protein